MPNSTEALIQRITALEARTRKPMPEVLPSPANQAQITSIITAINYMHPPNVPRNIQMSVIASSLGVTPGTATATPWFFVAGRYYFGGDASGITRIVYGNNQSNATGTLLQLVLTSWTNNYNGSTFGAAATNQAAVQTAYALNGFQGGAIWGAPDHPIVATKAIVLSGFAWSHSAWFARYINVSGGNLTAGGDPTTGLYELVFYPGYTT